MVNNMTIAELGFHDPYVSHQEARQVEGKPRAFRREISTNTHEVRRSGEPKVTDSRSILLRNIRTQNPAEHNLDTS